MQTNKDMAAQGEGELFQEVNFDSIINEFETLDLDGGSESDKDNTGKGNVSDSEGTPPVIENEDLDNPEINEDDDDESIIGSEGDEDDSSPLIPYAKLLAEEGILPNLVLDDFEKNPSTDTLKAAMLSEINNGVESYKKTLPTEISKLLDNYEEGVPLLKLLEIDSKKAEYSAIEDSKIEGDVTLQKSLLKDYYKNTTKFSDEKINKMIQRHEDLDELELEAKSSLGELVQLEEANKVELVNKAKADKLALEAQSAKDFEDFKKSVTEATEIIPGMTLNDNTKNKIISIMSTPVGEDKYGNPLTAIGKARADNPIKFERDLAYLFLTTNGFSDYSAIKSSGKKDAISDFENSIRRFDKGGKGSVGNRQQSESEAGVVDAVEGFLNTNPEDFFKND